jgi:hypothetical protein
VCTGTEKKADAVLGLVVVCFLLLLTILVVVCYICIRHKPQAYQPGTDSQKSGSAAFVSPIDPDIDLRECVAVAKEVKPFEQLPPADAPPIYFHRNPEERVRWNKRGIAAAACIL